MQNFNPFPNEIKVRDNTFKKKYWFSNGLHFITYLSRDGVRLFKTICDRGLYHLASRVALKLRNI